VKRTATVQRIGFLPSVHSSSGLVRLLGAGEAAAEAPAGMDVAERLSLWFGALDAITLQGLHQQLRAITTPASDRTRTSTPAELAEEYRQVRGVLAKMIARPVEMASDAPRYADYERRQQQLQRQMEQMISALRDHARQACAKRSPSLRQLATLDAAFEQLLAHREQTLLPKAAGLLKSRFDGGSDAFVETWRQALLAELDLRLEPAAGLLAALDKEWNIPR
jgi:hypothetical protein